MTVFDGVTGDSRPADISMNSVEHLLRAVLQRRFPGDMERQRLLRRSDRINFCCPFCGDSTVSTKKRGNLYTSTLSYVCYNGGCEKHSDVVRMAEHFGVQGALDEDELSSARKQISAARDIMSADRARRSDLSLDSITSTDFKSLLVSREELMKEARLQPIFEGSRMGNYLAKRFQKLDSRFAWDSRRNRLFVLNLDRSGEWVFGFQTRQFDDGPAKYLTYNLSGMLVKWMRVEDAERLAKAREMDHLSTMFGIFHLNFNEPVTLFEGPLDAFLYRNSVGMCSIKNDWPFDTDNYRWLQDNDEAGRKKALELIGSGKSAFLWKKLIDDYGLHGKKIKDYNDLIIHQMTSGLRINNIETYFSTHRYDGVYL